MTRNSMISTLIIGVGGATNSGKTTLAKHVLSLLPAGKGVMLHQDDFALPEAQLPWNGALSARDWDHPIGTIDYRRLQSVLEHAREHGQLPPHHSSHDHLNVQPDLPIDAVITDDARTRIKAALDSLSVQRVILADGFLLYYDQAVRAQMDVRLFLRCKPETLERRRATRGGYATAEETVWQDPPGYFEHVVWPAYVLAHKGMFEDGDVISGKLIDVKEDGAGDGTPSKNITLIEAESTSIDQTVERAVDAILAGLRRLPSQ